jgi:hypothetical protein
MKGTSRAHICSSSRAAQKNISEQRKVQSTNVVRWLWHFQQSSNHTDLSIRGDMDDIWAEVPVSKNEDADDSGSGSGSGELAYSQSRAGSIGSSMGSVDSRNGSWSDFRPSSRASLHERLSSRSRLYTMAPVRPITASSTADNSLFLRQVIKLLSAALDLLSWPSTRASLLGDGESPRRIGCPLSVRIAKSALYIPGILQGTGRPNTWARNVSNLALFHDHANIQCLADNRPETDEPCQVSNLTYLLCPIDAL